MNSQLNSIGLLKKPSETTVVVAMSGGVDSSTVAGIMKRDGYNVIGITLKLYDDGKEVASSKQCCSGQDIMDAKRVAQKLGIEHKILYYQDKFKQGVIDNFVESYLKGETPIPCVQCNQTVKFKDLFEVSKELNADALITGHYVKSITSNNETNMYRAIDENRDQSYFLFNTTREQLNYLRFPLGGMFKNETRSIANKFFPSTKKPDPSMEVIGKSFFSSLKGILLLARVFQFTSSGYEGRRTLVISCPFIQNRAPSSRIASIFIIEPIGSSLN